ncbi:MAG: (d)CMP kinase [Flavobacteriales bacterium TMED235]|nr:MAG: (d)CMP kinase [Flavobacteriales bacterium TMED235]
MDKAIIAIDGFAATGKSTLAKRLSKHLDLPYVDSGAFFRGITFLAMEKGWITDKNIDEISLEEGINKVKINFDSFSNTLTLNKRDITDQIRSKLVTSKVSKIAKLPFVRSYLLKQQRLIVTSNGLVMDGRDIGTAVFPEADFKFFFTAKPEVRAQRRWEEMEANGYLLSYNEVLKNILDRDKIDTERKVSPLKKAEDAIEIDSTDLSLQQVFEVLINKINGK